MVRPVLEDSLSLSMKFEFVHIATNDDRMRRKYPRKVGDVLVEWEGIELVDHFDLHIRRGKHI